MHWGPVLVGVAAFLVASLSWRLIGRLDRWARRRRDAKRGTPVAVHDEPTPPTWISRYWWLIAGVGVVLLVVGITTGSHTLERGGPMILGTLCVLGGLVGLRRRLGHRIKPR